MDQIETAKAKAAGVPAAKAEAAQATLRSR